MATQVRFRHSEDRAYYDRKLKDGKTNKEARRCPKRRVSDAIFAHLVADAKRKADVMAKHETAIPAVDAGPGGQMGNGSIACAAGSHPERQLFGQATPGPTPTIEPRAAAGRPKRTRTVEKKTRRAS